METEGEECLDLNVWTPDPKASGLPAQVWIQGGSFAGGANSLAAYDGRPSREAENFLAFTAIACTFVRRRRLTD
ncbi:carboxylesterase family protein [Streptomyces sp. NPDC093990]|uniref:carboxylesterase family protein n=1 Tax=Streptomyces sp. NPDC093990 TaxID=3155306 RepID=UPI0034407F0E